MTSQQVSDKANKKGAFPVLLLGYGNADREDDGVAWHTMSRLAKRLRRSFPAKVDQFVFQPGEAVDFCYALQLTPEMATTIQSYARVCFIDAHTGSVPQDLQLTTIQPSARTSPFTHHLTPTMLLNLAQTMYPTVPKCILVSIRGYQFGFCEALSPATDALADQAVGKILDWITGS